MHVRTSGYRHYAISGVHIIARSRVLGAQELKRQSLGAPGVICPVCQAAINKKCRSVITDEHYPFNMVHLDRARIAEYDI